MGWQTFCKLAENAYNNLPIGYSHSRYQDNTELLKILTPNMLRVGRVNSRALQGPIRLPVSKKELLEHVEKIYSGWFKIFKDTVVPRLIHQPKWFKIDQDLKEKDIVYFQKSESALGSTWTIGEVDQVIVGRDGLIRRAIIKYFNASENDPEQAQYKPQLTDRAVRSLVKLWSMDEACLFDDLAELQDRVDGVEGQGVLQGDDRVAAADGVQASIAGYIAGVGAVPPVAGPAYHCHDDLKVDIALYTSSCDVTPLVVHKMETRIDWEQDQERDRNEEINNMDTLYKVMVSTNLTLD